MNVVRAVIAGATVWLLVISTFTVLAYLPMVGESSLAQSVIVICLMAVFSSAGAWIYYKDVSTDHGSRVGLLASATALLLDVLITVPFFEIPNGGGYVSFFTSPVLWTLVIINVLTFYMSGRRRASA
ncbi:DUF5367 family protein [Chryseolinea sp. T2]|uniref:DUF5367 family protein n=1 Tax=Chryseolinea sp. T2 TaxID=3129255 RepID=UPI003077ED71